MIAFLITLGIVYVFIRYVLPYLLRRHVERTFGFDPRAAHGKSRHAQESTPKPEPVKKKIDPTVGEYVEFTETTTTTTRETPEGTETTVNIEQQVTDIQWEDIPVEK